MKILILSITCVIFAFFLGYFVAKYTIIIHPQPKKEDNLAIYSGSSPINIIQTGGDVNPNVAAYSGTAYDFTGSIIQMISILGSGNTDPIDMNALPSPKKVLIKNIVDSIPLDMRQKAIALFPKMRFSANSKLYLYDPDIQFESGKIDQDDDKVRWFNTCALPRIQGKPHSDNPYLQDKIALIDQFYASNWSSLDSNNDGLAKMLTSFQKAGFCDPKNSDCIFFGDPQKMRSMILDAMEANKNIYKIPNGESWVQMQVDLYLTCILPKYITSPEEITVFMNQVGPFPSLLGMKDDVIINNFFNSLDSILNQ